MWTLLELALSILWTIGVVLGWTLGGLLHVLAILAVALVLIEGTPLERRIRSSRTALDGPRRTWTRRARQSAAAIHPRITAGRPVTNR